MTVGGGAAGIRGAVAKRFPRGMPVLTSDARTLTYNQVEPLQPPDYARRDGSTSR